MRKLLVPRAVELDPNAPSAWLILPAAVEPKILRRWREWEPWVLLYLQQRGYYSPQVSVELERMRRVHRQDILILTQAGITMRGIRKYRLDNPRMTEEARAVLRQDAMARRETGCFQ
jgi:hypothetical protein